MITPEKTKYVLNSLNVHKELQESILRDIARRLVKNSGTITDTAAWQAEKLQQAGLLLDDITKELETVTKRQKEEIKKAFEVAETKIFDYDDEVIAEAGFDPEEFKKLSPAMQKTWQATLSKTSTEAINLTKTTALTSQSAYIEACDLAMMQVQSGAFTLDAAVKNACVAAGSKGVNVIYPSGWVDKLDVAIRRSTFTGVSQTAGKLQEMRADEMDQDIMELSAHAGARPEHAAWQGQLVSRSGKPGYLSLADIGYGTVTGFKGVNCSHEWFIFFVGISKRAYTEEQLEAFKNETVTYNGKEVPLWKAKDYQRAVERAVKETKRQLVVLDEAMKNAKTDSLRNELKTEFSSRSVLLKKQEARLKDFCKQTGIYYDNSRLQIFTQATENGIKNWGKSVSGKAVGAAQKHYDIWRKSIGAENTPKTLAKYYEMKYNNPKEYKRLQKYAKTVKQGESSPLLGYDEYSKVAKQVEERLIGIRTVNDVVIEDYSAHFVSRVIGRSGITDKTNRSGVQFEDIIDTLKYGDVGKEQYDPNGDLSVALLGERCIVTINPDKKSLVQTNRYKGKVKK